MILKTFEIQKQKHNKGSIFLLYGENEGLKSEIINKFFLNEGDNLEIIKYEEKEIFDNYSSIFSSMLNKSFFEEEKIIIINRASDKILNFIEEVLEKKIDKLKIILIAGMLEKRSKLRLFFEKNKELICVPFYPDDFKTLNLLAIRFFKNQKISISQEIVNTIIDRCNGNRKHLETELNKIKLFLNENKTVNIEDVFSLVNLSENFSVTELVDSCLLKNKNKIIKILNENSYSNEDCILIIRTFLAKLKRLMILRKNYEDKKDIEVIIRDHKPPIFWKDKAVVVEQLKKWGLDEIKNLIISTNHIEFLIKKSSQNSLKILYDFIIGTSKYTNN